MNENRKYLFHALENLFLSPAGKASGILLPVLILLPFVFGCGNQNTVGTDNAETCDKCKWITEQEIRKIIQPVIYGQDSQPDKRLTEAARSKIAKADLGGGIKFWGCICENDKVYFRLWGASGQDFELELTVLSKTEFSITDLRPAKFVHP